MRSNYKQWYGQDKTPSCECPPEKPHLWKDGRCHECENNEKQKLFAKTGSCECPEGTPNLLRGECEVCKYNFELDEYNKGNGCKCPDGPRFNRNGPGGGICLGTMAITSPSYCCSEGKKKGNSHYKWVDATGCKMTGKLYYKDGGRCVDNFTDIENKGIKYLGECCNDDNRGFYKWVDKDDVKVE